MSASRKRYLIVVVGILLLLGIVFLFRSKSYNFPSLYNGEISDISSILEAQEELDSSIYRLPETVNQNGLNFIFLSDGYLSWEEFEKDVEALMREIKTIEPWKSYNDYNV